MPRQDQDVNWGRYAGIGLQMLVGVGLGYVDDETPQLGIALFPKYQHQGHGEPLMRAALEAARRQLESCQQTISGMARELCIRSESLSAIFSCSTQLGRTSDLGLGIDQDPIHVHDLQATILHCLGMDHTRLTYRYLGRDFRLTDVSGNVVHKMLA